MQQLQKESGACLSLYKEDNAAHDDVAFEMAHMVLVARKENDALLKKGWKEVDTNSIFFMHLARYCKHHRSDLSPECTL